MLRRVDSVSSHLKILYLQPGGVILGRRCRRAVDLISLQRLVSLLFLLQPANTQTLYGCMVLNCNQQTLKHCTAVWY